MVDSDSQVTEILKLRANLITVAAISILLLRLLRLILISMPWGRVLAIAKTR